MKQNYSTPFIIYILGAGGSGSSILTSCLGSHSEILPIGELSFFDLYKALDKLCNCGIPLSKCKFWKSIFLSSYESGYGVPIKPIIKINDILLHRIKALSKDPILKDTIAKNLSIYNKISTQNNKIIILDSSKDITRFYYLIRSGEIRILPIHMVRDGRAYIDSLRRRSGMHPIKAIIRWMRLNLITYFILNKVCGKYDFLTITYDEFVDYPETVIKKILSRLDLCYEQQVFNHNLETQHTLGGTSVRNGEFIPEYKPKLPLESKQTSKNRISWSARLCFLILGGPKINKLFGIQDGK
jgi:hypothetical protein